jgi:hypothetical protein
MHNTFSLVTFAVAALALTTSLAMAESATAKKDTTIRFEPSSHSDEVGQLYAGDIVEVIDCTDGWCEIDYTGLFGYVKESRLKFMPVQPVQAKACFYEHINYEGQMFCENAGTTESIIDMAWNDMISSVKLYGGAKVQVCEHINFGGACSTWVADKPSVGQSWNDRVSAYSVY